MAMLFRFFYALGGEKNTFKNSKGQPTSALFGTAKFLTQVALETKPDYLVATSDSKHPTFRHELYPEYKAHRKDMPELLQRQIQEYFRLLDNFKIKLFKQDGFEADDIIGSLVQKFASPQCHCYIISGDKDFCQLVNEHVFLLNPFQKSFELLGPQEVRQKYQLSPDQFIDYLALIGDDSDNIPGCHGIGKVGALKLLQEYGTLDGIYQNLDEIRNARTRNALTTHRELTYLSKKLATIKTDATITSDSLDDFVMRPYHEVFVGGLEEQYAELEFSSLLNASQNLKKNSDRADMPSTLHGAHESLDRDYDSQSKSPDSATVLESHRSPGPSSTRSHHYKLVVDGISLDLMCEDLASAEELVIDTETTGLSIIGDMPIGICLSRTPGTGYYVPLIPEHTPLNPSVILTRLRPLLLGQALKIGHHLKFDLQMLAQVGLEVQGPFYDTMIMDWLLRPGLGGHGLDDCCYRYFQFKKIPTEEIFALTKTPRGGSSSGTATVKVSLEKLAEYGCEDADYTLRLFHYLQGEIERLGLRDALERVEMPVLPILGKMERHGIAIDRHTLSELSHHLDQLIEKRAQEIFTLVGSEFNINSPKQLGEILFERLKIHEELGIKKIKKTKTGYSTDESVLTSLKAHPLPRLLLEYRTVSKLKNTYVDALPKLIHPKTQKVHTTFHQTGTATGRLSSTEPNLQNIPIRSALGQDIRRAFIPSEPGWILISADYSQVELRILAHLAGEEALIAAFRSGEDVHKTTASKIFGVPPSEVDQSMRAKAKAINFGIIYGMGPRRLSQETGVPLQQASQFIKKYFESYPGIKSFVDKTIEFSKTHHYVKTISGRRRPIDRNLSPEALRGNLDNIAVNTPIQGSAADLIKIAMSMIDRGMKDHQLKARLLLQVHDELVFEAPPEEQKTLTELITRSMTQAMSLEVPLEVNVGYGPNWLEAH
jgi:DNA polymerase-1